MHPFYHRISKVFKRAGSNRNRFCQKTGFNYQTLQSYWNTDKLPPGAVLESLAKEYNVSIDALVFGKVTTAVGYGNPDLSRLLVLLKQFSKDELLQVEGAVRMMQFLNLNRQNGSTEQETALKEWEKIEELPEADG